VATEVGVREGKLIQYLNEAYGKEKQLEQALSAHIKQTTNAPYKKKLQAHLKETKAHARSLQQRIKALGGKAEAVDLPGPDAVSDVATGAASVVGKAVAAAQGAVQAARGTSIEEKLLKQAKDQYHEEAEEIANYTAIIQLADSLSDKDTVKIAKAILREEQRMAKYLEGLIPKLTKAVVTAEIPARQRKPQTGVAPASSRSSSSRASSSRSSGGSTKRSTSRSSGSSSRAKSSSSSSRAKSSSSSSRAKSSSSSARKPAASRAKSSSSSSRSTARKSSANGSSGSTTAKRSSSSRSRSTAAKKS